MESGPIAFYEVAATLIPLLFVGSIVIENVRPPKRKKKIAGTDFAGMSSHQAKELVATYFPWRWARGFSSLLRWTFYWSSERWFIYLIACALPIAAGWVVFAEIVAIDAVASRSSSSFHAWVVGGTLLAGALVVLLVLWLPWLRKLAGAVPAESKLAILSVAGALLAGVGAVLVLAFASAPHINGAFADKAPEFSASSREKIWLEHLIATSDYRIVKLEAESATGKSGELRAAPHLATQENVQERECHELANLISDESNDQEHLPTACP